MSYKKWPSYHDLTAKDFPAGEVVLKKKNGLWYRPDNKGYTDNILFAGLYEREEALDYCFNEFKNGYCDVYAVPLRKALDEAFMGIERIAQLQERLKFFEPFASLDEPTVIF